jgi:hypothetical protein
MTRDVATGLCPRCRAEIAQANQAAMLDGVKGFEDRILRLMLRPLPKAWVPGLERMLVQPRFRGFMKFIGGLIVAAATFMLTLALGRWTGTYVASAVVGLPLAISMIGSIEIVLGINFADLAKKFDEEEFLFKCSIAVVVLFFVAVYLAGGVLIYQRYFQ